MGRRKQFTDEELRERRRCQWYESRCRCGHVGVCPLCGGYTRSVSGYHPSCAKKAGLTANHENGAKEQLKRCGRKAEK